jgi:hypothetical protein
MKRHPVRPRYRMVELQHWRDKRGLKFHLQSDRGYLRRALAAVWERSAQSRRSRNDRETRCLIGAARQLVKRSGAEAITAADEPNRKDAGGRRVRLAGPTCWRAKCSGDRTASNCWKMR